MALVRFSSNVREFISKKPKKIAQTKTGPCAQPLSKETTTRINSHK